MCPAMVRTCIGIANQGASGRSNLYCRWPPGFLEPPEGPPGRSWSPPRAPRAFVGAWATVLVSATYFTTALASRRILDPPRYPPRDPLRDPPRDLPRDPPRDPLRDPPGVPRLLPGPPWAFVGIAATIFISATYFTTTYEKILSRLKL